MTPQTGPANAPDAGPVKTPSARPTVVPKAGAGNVFKDAANAANAASSALSAERASTALSPSSASSASSSVVLQVVPLEEWRTLIALSLLPISVFDHGIAFHQDCKDTQCPLKKVPHQIRDEWKSAREDFIRNEYQNMMAEQEEKEKERAAAMAKKKRGLVGLAASRFAH